MINTKTLIQFCLLSALLLTVDAGAQSNPVYTSLHSFGIYTNGAYPAGTLVQGSDGNFYGTTSGGGTNGGYGTVFEVTTNGGLTILHTFNGGNDGDGPQAGLVQGSDGNFYGTAGFGGAYGYGTVFKISAGGAFTSFYSFTGGNDGAYPKAALVQGSDGNLYGTTFQGGTNYQGSLFKVSTNGTFTSLYSFSATKYNGNGYNTNSDGSAPQAALALGPDGNFYGTTEVGGSSGVGTVFRVTTNGVLTTLHSFSALSSSYPQTNPDGSGPQAALTLGPGGNFYGTTEYGGTNGYGTVFKISTNEVFSSLYSFYYATGANPLAGLVQGSDGNFYGTTYDGGSIGVGTVFKISTNGILTSLYSFTGGNDGAYPRAALVQDSDGNLYGTTYHGGSIVGFSGVGVVFEISTNGALASLYSFPSGDDGVNPYAGLVQGNDGNFYGTTEVGGANGNGTVFKIGDDGTLTTLYSFTGDNDGGDPQAGLVQGSDGNFYGTASEGGTNGAGTVFKISASGAFTSLYSFTGGNDGDDPQAGLVQGSDGNFYGTTENGGTNGNGTVFKISASGAFSSLYSFTGGNDGGEPEAGLVQGSDGNFYGTTEFDGTNGWGTVFKISADGAFTGLYSFTDGNDGAYPEAGLVPGSDGNFYGTASQGGTNYAGTVFKISAGGAFTSLYSFTDGNDGGEPEAGLIQGSDGNFYGTTYSGGTNGDGAIFEISASGLLTPLYSFTDGNGGGNPQAGLVQGFDGNFYGTTYSGGIGGNGTVFSLSTGLTGHAIVQFTASSTNGAAPLTVQFKTPEVDVLGNPIVSWSWNFGDGATSGLQNPSHTYNTVGIFAPTLIATNNQGVEVIGFGPQIITSPTNLVQNGGFATGDFAGWTTNGNFEFCFVTTDPTYVHSGNYGAEFGPSGSLGYLSQTLATVPGQSYVISLWLDSPDGSTPNEFLVNWNGNTLFDQTDIPAIGWTNLQFIVTATGASTVLQFGFRDDLSYLGLDNISIVPILNGTIQFTATPTNGAVPLTVQFNSPDIDSLGNPIVSWSWNFGDGATSTLQDPSHTYTTMGTFTPVLVTTNINDAAVIGSGPQIKAFLPSRVTYSYTGLIFGDGAISYEAPGSGLSSSTFISASITYNSALAPNLNDFTSDASSQPDLPSDWLFSDGIEQWTPTNSSFYVAQVDTDANGNITGWYFDLYSNPGFTDPEVYIISSTPSSYGSEEVNLPFTAPDVTAYCEYGPGVDPTVWAETNVPNVQFTATPANGEAPLPVEFNASSVDNLGNVIASWSWNFGDGTTSTLQDPSHTYTTAGIFTPTLVATNINGVEVIGYGSQVTVTAPASSGNPTGSFLWSERIASIANTWPSDEPNTGLALDTNDNCYVTGWFDNTNNFGGVTLTNHSTEGGSDIFVAKYNSTGALQWAQQAGGTAGNPNNGRGIGLDTSGNVYVDGGYYGSASFGGFGLPSPSSGDEGFFLAKYNNAGAVQWVQNAIGPIDNIYGIGLTVDDAGNSYALVFINSNDGTTINFGSVNVPVPADDDSSTVLVKYDSNGNAKWAVLMGGGGEVYATKVAVDSAGNVYVHGLFEDTLTIGTSTLTLSAGSSEDTFVAKFNSSGTLLWVQQPQGNSSEGGVAVDSAGNVYISSGFMGTLNFGNGIILTNLAPNALFGDGFVAKYNSAGAIQWAEEAGGTNGAFYWDVALDGQDNVYPAGFYGVDAAVTKYNSNGALQWTYAASGPPASPVSSLVGKCAVDAAGNCFLDGWYQGTATFGTNTLQPQETWNFFLTELISSTSAIKTAGAGFDLQNGQFGFNINGGDGSAVVIEASTNLANPVWVPVATNTLVNGTNYFSDPQWANYHSRFYRVTSP